MLVSGMLFLTSCEKDKSDDAAGDSGVLTGTYTGTFYRSNADTVTVSIEFFDNGTYSGQSNREKYPAICHGTYSWTGDIISFDDECAWTADFDWTLILDGDFNIRQDSNNQLTLTRSSGVVTDTYKIKPFYR